MSLQVAITSNPLKLVLQLWATSSRDTADLVCSLSFDIWLEPTDGRLQCGFTAYDRDSNSYSHHLNYWLTLPADSDINKDYLDLANVLSKIKLDIDLGYIPYFELDIDVTGNKRLKTLLFKSAGAIKDTVVLKKIPKS